MASTSPEDLNPNKEFFLSLSSKVLEIPENSTFSFEEFVTKLDVKTGCYLLRLLCSKTS